MNTYLTSSVMNNIALRCSLLFLAIGFFTDSSGALHLTKAQNPLSLSSGTAQTLLETAGLAQFEEPVYLPDENKSMQINTPKENNFPDVDIDDYFEVYPNPASKKSEFE
ncbi:MAG: hypothetical protein ABIJ97_13585 [Bacteroidota bacterium]